MIKRFKIVILFCLIAILFNIVVRFTIINQQEYRVTVLQKVIAAARSGSYTVKKQPEVKSVAFKEQAEINKILNIIPQELAFTKYASTIRNLVDKNNLFIDEKLTFKPEKIDDESLLKFNTKLIVAGDYPKLKKFISDIQNIPGVPMVNSASFTRADDDSSNITLRLDLSVLFKRETA